MKRLRKFLMLIAIIISSFAFVGCDGIKQPQTETPIVDTNNKYSVKWENYDGTLLETSSNLDVGDTPEYKGVNPTRPSTDEYDYIFVGWSPKVRPVSENMIYAANFVEVLRKYDITWINSGGEVLLKISVYYGEMPIYTGKTPTLVSSATSDFEFSNWKPALKPVTNNQIYIAEYTESAKKHTIKWNDANGKLLGTTKVENGKMPTYALPDNSAEWNYQSWSPAVVAASRDATYTAVRTKNQYMISYSMDDGTLIQSRNLSYGVGILTNVSEPVKPGYIFDGWFTRDGLRIYPSEIVRENLNIYAKFSQDYVSLMNYIQTETIKANVKIEVENYNMTMDIVTDSAWILGSGVIFMEQGGNYYVLTNNHVTAKLDGYNYANYIIYDYKGDAYEAAIYNQAYDPNYDLAVLYFTKVDELLVIEMETSNPVVGDEVISMGQPAGQLNAVTFDEVIGYDKVYFVEPDPTSTVNFRTITHTAPIKGGSSGGVLINLSLKLVGINFASAVDPLINEANAIPITKAKEFLNKHGWELPNIIK